MLTAEQQQELRIAQGYDLFAKSGAGQDFLNFIGELEQQALEAVHSYDGSITAETLVIRYQQRQFVCAKIRDRFKEYQELKDYLITELNREEPE